MYKQTRGIHDESYVHNQVIMQDRPLRYITSDVQSERLMKHSHPESIDMNTFLRSKPTHLNTLERDNCELFGTAPLRLGVLPNEIEIENDVKFSKAPKITGCEKMLTERTFQFVDDVHVDSFTNTVDTAFRATSTRVDRRNQNAQNMNCRR